MFLILLGSLACLLPLALYCLYLALLHQRRRPTMVPGPWDFAGVLLALSGFILVGVPALLTAFHEAWRRFWLSGRGFAELRRPQEEVWPWLVVWGLAGLVVVLGAVVMLVRRRAVTVIYNVTPDRLHDGLGQVLTAQGLEWTRRGNRFFVGRRSPARGLPANGPIGPAEIPGLQEGAVFEVDVFAAMRHATIDWQRDDGPLRPTVEAELAGELARAESPPSGVAGWFLTVASCLFAVMFFGLGLFVVFLYASAKS